MEDEIRVKIKLNGAYEVYGNPEDGNVMITERDGGN